jgi:peptide-methionine (S)-S-oxide reductase
MTPSIETITLGGGCFWCLEAVYEQVHGVVQVQSGYANGHTECPTYEQVCTGRTGYNEVVQLQFNPEQISLQALLEIFFLVHNPTTLNQQGNDVGTQYRSGIYLHNSQQACIAHEVIKALQQSTAAVIMTEVELLKKYTPAEPYHQHYFAQHPTQGYCMAVIAPKLEKFKRTYQQYTQPS